MSTPSDDELGRMVYGPGIPQPRPAAAPAFTDPTPYGTAPTPAHQALSAPKAGLSKRGKAAVGIGAAVLATGTLLGYQSYSAQAAKDAAIAKELELKAQVLRLEEMKEINRAKEASVNSVKGTETARQKSVDACVNTNKGLVGKGYGSPTYRQVIDDCQAQYEATVQVGGMQAASSSTPTNTTTGDDANGGALLGIGALALAIWAACAKRSARTTA